MVHSTETIWQAYSAQLKAYISKRIIDTSFVDDLLQEVFIKIHEKIWMLKDDEKISNWIYHITKNVIIDYYRKKKIKFSDIQKISEERVMLIGEDDNICETPEQRLASGLTEMINALPEKYSQALNLVEIGDLSQIQLAEKLDISVSGAKSRVQRGRRLLKNSLLECCHYEFDRYGTIISYHSKSCCVCNKSK